MSNTKNVQTLHDIDSIKYSLNDMTLEIPEPVEGEINIVGSTALPVIDLSGNVYEPLHTKNVKVTLERSSGHEAETKEFTVTIAGTYEDQGSNPAPKVIPEVAEWYGLQGTMKVNNETCVIVSDTRFQNAADMLIQDVQELGLQLESADHSKTNTITFTFNDNHNYGEEGYGIVIEDQQVEIHAESHTGAYFATRTLHQMLKMSHDYQLNNGYIRDYPKYAVRGFMFDVGRKFVKLDYLYEIMKTMSYYKMNDFQVHLNDNAIFLNHYKDTEDALANAYSGHRLESDIEGNGYALTSQDGYYTKEAFTQFMNDAAKHGITIVPEFDTPGHALSFVRVRPDLMYDGPILDGKTDQERAAMLNLEHEETIPFIQSMYNEFLDGENPVIGNVPVHIGSDEYYGEAEVYRKYVDEMLAFIRDDKKRTPRVWGSLTIKDGETPVTSENVQMSVWNTEWANPDQMLEQGYNIINIEDEQIYIVPGADYYHDYLNVEQLYFQYEPNKFKNGTIVDESHPQLLGGAYGLWNDLIDTVENGITSYDMFDRLFEALPILAQKNWGTQLSKSFDDFQAISSKTMYAPRTNPRFKLNAESNTIFEYDFSNEAAGNSENDDFIKTNQVKFSDGAHFNGRDSLIELPYEVAGPPVQLEVWFELTDTNKPQILLDTDDYGTLFAVDEDGYIGYEHEGNHYSFDYKLEANQMVKLQMVTSLHQTQLFVDDIEISMTEQSKKPFNTFLLPIQRIGSLQNSLNGKIKKLSLRQ